MGSGISGGTKVGGFIIGDSPLNNAERKLSIKGPYLNDIRKVY